MILRQVQIRRSHPHYSWNLLWAVHTAAAVIARADGGVHLTERLALESYLRRCEVEDLKSPLARGLFDKCLRELEHHSGSERYMLSRVLAGFGGTPWAWIILRAAEHVAAADGAVHRAEIQTIETIRTLLDLPPGVPERYPACVLWLGRA